ncbi:transposase [Aquibium carbonis]|uniref:Transposase n=1 Tax=Aquibium carbonis TaxID=2495581 RepID=A0A3R9YD22_9HYPH|nr:IS3 family transposase [Aquibium carbonis]RST84793.1 transposase [Aquibium carbonis]
MGIARSTFYDRPAVSVDDTALVERMVAISDSFEAYGYRRMQAALRQQGMVVNHKKLRRLMREHDLQPRRRRRYVVWGASWRWQWRPTRSMRPPLSKSLRNLPFASVATTT